MPGTDKDKMKITVGYEGHYEDLEVTVPAGDPPPWDAKSELRVVGKRIPRLDGEAKVTGRAKYTYDVHPPGLLYGSILRATVPAGRISSIDLSAARGLPGVKAVWGEKVGKRIFFGGQEVAAVCAVSPEIADDALRLIKVEYSRLPFVVDPTKARDAGSPLVFDSPAKAPKPDDDEEFPGAKQKHQGNVRTTVASDPRNADMTKTFADAEVIVERTYRTQVQTHAALETHGSVAKWDGDRLTLWSSTQGTFGVRDQIAQALKMPKDKVTVLCDYMGGGFGAKFSAGHWSIIAARLAKEAGAPVRMMLPRRDEHLCTGNRPDSIQWIKLGAKRDGTLIAIHLKSYGTPGVGTGAGAGGPVRGIYKWKSWKTEESDVFTNGGEAQAFRAPGHPQGCFALEQAMDELAEKLGMDPVALRLKNVLNPIQAEELRRISARVDAWKKRRAPGASNGELKRGVGLACGVWYKIVSKGTQAQIDVHSDGRVEVKNGAQDIGTGTRTIMAQVAAEELGLSMDMVTVRLGDTSLPFGPGSGGSTTTTSIAPAVRAAAWQAKQKLFEITAKSLKAETKELEAADGRIFVKADPNRAMTWKQAASRIPGDKLSVMATRAPDYEGTIEKTGGVQIAEVEVDTGTGAVKVLRVTVTQDFGRPLNPLTAESQINGGVIQGVSYALFEDRVMDRNVGLMVNPDLESYKIAFANDCPVIDVDVFHVEKGFNSTGAIGLGEPPTVPTAAAIANAVYNAIGARVHELPITPDRVLAAIREKANR